MASRHVLVRAIVLFALVALPLQGIANADDVPVVVGGPKAEQTIAAPGQQARFAFHGAAGTHVSARFTHITYWDDVHLETPSGAILWESLSCTPCGSRFTEPLTLPESGIYTIVIVPDGDATGTVGTQVWDVPPDLAATAVSNGVPTSLTVSNPGQNARITFAAPAGQSVRLLLGTPSWWDPIAVFAPDGSTFWSIGSCTPCGDRDTGWLRIPQTGTYTVVFDLDGDVTGTVTTRLFLAPEPQQFEIAPGVVAIPHDVAGAGAGAIESVSAQDHYSFNGVAGERVVFDQVATSTNALRWRLRGPDGFTLFDRDLDPCCDQGEVVLPRSGRYVVEVYGSGVATGTYSVGIASVGTATASPSLTQTFSLSTGDQVRTNVPMPGAGIIESAAARDVYLLEAESGQAIALDAVQCRDDIHWNLRDPAGALWFERAFCDVGPFVLPDRGTWTLTVGKTNAAVEYAFDVLRTPATDEAARPGQPPPPAALTRVADLLARAGGTTTIAVYGTSLPQPTGLLVTKDGSVLPTQLLSATAVRGSAEGRLLEGRIDLTAASPGAYTIAVRFEDGKTLTYPEKFVADATLGPRIAVALDSRPMRARAVNRTYVTISNPTAVDYYDLPMTIVVPCSAHAALLADEFPKEEWLRLLEQLDAPAHILEIARNMEFPAREEAERYADGMCRIGVWIPIVPAHDVITLVLETRPPAPGSGTVQVIIPDEGSHLVTSVGNPLLGVGGGGSGGGGAGEGGPADTQIQEAIEHAERVTSKAMKEVSLGALTGAFMTGLGAIVGEVVSTLVDWSGFIDDVATTVWDYVTSRDPNEIVGPAGVGANRIVAAGARVTYTVFFENEETAGVPAQFVRVRIPLSPALDWATVKVEAFEVAGRAASLAGPGPATSGTIALPFDGGTVVTVGSRLAVASGALEFTLAGPPQLNDPFNPSPYGDFLPPNASSPDGEGHVRFSIRVRDDAASGTVIAEQATIIFDEHELGGSSLTTAVWTNTIGAPPDAPAKPRARASKGRITVSWKPPRQDGGSPITGYTVAASPGGATITAAPAKRPNVAFEGLTPGVPYTFTVVAMTAGGASAPSVPSRATRIKVPRVPS